MPSMITAALSTIHAGRKAGFIAFVALFAALVMAVPTSAQTNPLRDRPRPPSISDVRPAITTPGGRIVITGRHLGSVLTVTMSGVSLPIESKRGLSRPR